MQELALIREIDAAFAAVELGKGVSLHMAAYDESLDPKDLEDAERDERADWRNIAADEIAAHPDIFSSLDLEGLRFHLPAYMVWTLRNFRSAPACACNEVLYTLDPASLCVLVQPELDNRPVGTKRLPAQVNRL